MNFLDPVRHHAAGYTTNTVYDQVRSERQSQNAQWGGSYYDDRHSAANWCDCIMYQIGHMRRDDSFDRQRFIKIASLAIAAVVSFDRT